MSKKFADLLRVMVRSLISARAIDSAREIIAATRAACDELTGEVNAASLTAAGRERRP